jgi:hypothetical protein
MVRIIRLHSVKTLGLKGRAFPQSEREGRHPAHAARDSGPGVAGHAERYGLALSVVERGGGQHGVGEVQGAHVQHAQVHQLQQETGR